MKTTLCLTLTLLTFVTFAFVPNSFAEEVDRMADGVIEQPQQQERPIVKVIYFIPNDVQPQPDIDEQIDTQVKRVQTLYADLMEAHGFERKTFRSEKDAEGKVVVHHRHGTRNDAYYQKNPGSAWNEFPKESDSLNDFYLVFLDIDAESPDNTLCGLGYSYPPYRGGLFPASGGCNVGEHGINVIAHELAHGFGLAHDDRSDIDAQRIYLDSIDRTITTYCAAVWLDNHPAFNDGIIQRNNNTIVRFYSPELASPPNTIRLQFKITDPDGIHIVKLISPHSGGDLKVRDCKELNGVTDSTVEFVTNQLPYYTDRIVLRMLDGVGNFIEQHFSLNQPLPFPDPEDVHILDSNLAAAIRHQIGTSITTHTIADLSELEIRDKGIKDLTGIENAQNLMKLLLYHNDISDISPLSNLTQLHWLYIGPNNISDFTQLSRLVHLRLLDISGNAITEIPPLKDLIHLDFLNLSGNRISAISPLTAYRKLEKLFLSNNSISDISSLSEITKLKVLHLSGNTISDVSPLTKLTQLENLHLSSNQISDVSPLTGLINLRELYLQGNPIKNRKPLLELLRKNPDVKIYLKWGDKPLPVTLSYFRAEHTDAGVILNWTTESEVDNAGFYIYRSETKDGEFKVVNQNMVQGAGTTGERNEYTWTDTTAQPNTVYYFRIEDVSHAGVREQLATVRLRGFVSASGKLTTRWADLKTEN